MESQYIYLAKIHYYQEDKLLTEYAAIPATSYQDAVSKISYYYGEDTIENILIECKSDDPIIHFTSEEFFHELHNQLDI